MTEKRTFCRQHELPTLPIPTLEDTCSRYLQSLVEIQDPANHAHTKKVVERFLQNEGPQMQEALLEYAKNRESYIEEFWDDSYLLNNESVVLNLNPFFILEDEADRERGSQLRRAATLTLASLSFVHDLRAETLTPDDFRGKPLDMYQYSRLFGMARIPTGMGCQLKQHPESRHMVVIRRSQLYWLEVLDKENRPLLTESALIATLRTIVRDADQIPRTHQARDAVGLLTTEKRRTWSKYREELMKDPENQQYLSIVDSALFILCLDDNAPEDTSVLTQNMLCGSYELDDHIQVGTCLNRWYDKLQIIVCANSTAGINFEHSSTDGHTVLRFVGDIYTESLLEFARTIHPSTPSLFKAEISPYALGRKRRADMGPPVAAMVDEVAMRTTPKKLEWNFTDTIRRGIQNAEMRVSDLICQNESQVLEFKKYGKQFITKHGFSPDAFVQMAFQATYYSLYGRLVPTYEPAMTKAFLRGRTETIRTAQPSTAKFVKTWSNSGSSAQAKLDALREACASHVRISKESAAGQGFDRHMYALKALYQRQHPDQPLPEIFLDSGYNLSNNVVLSTSNCGNPALRIFGFGPVIQDGFGLGYIIKDNKITICASSKHLQTKRFLYRLERYFEEAQRDIIDTYKAANLHVNRTYIDHSGKECDVRTGLPISSGHGILQSMAIPVGSTGYSFYGNAEEEVIENLGYDPRKTLGKMVFVNEYD
ncbi:carnitine O-acetyltransferase [Malassezia nana]|uniref:Carnitine O-acetyltransferase n=1 Tax=Malassezia nana TaxID=180528 RepID=A0AAF0J6Z3_9BASI|nr:carnitine O-acetyltransferase [Malassezia nana]